MLNKLFTVVLITLTFYSFSQSEPNITTGGADNDFCFSICNAHNGGYAVTGSTRSFGAGSNDFYFLLIDSSGQIVVNKTYGWKHQDFFRSIIPIQDGYAFVGDAWDYGPGGLDIYMLTTDNLGVIKNSFMFGTTKRDNGFDILQTNDGGFLILGHSRLENPMGDIYLLKVNNSGEKEWQKSFAGEGNDYAFQIIKSSQDDGYVFIGSKNGFFDDVHADFKTHDADIELVKIDSDGNEIWKKVYGKSEHDFGNNLCSAPDGGYYLIGSSQSYGNGSFDMLLIKTDENGDEQWIKSFGGPEYEYGKSVVMNTEGDLYLLGSSKSYGTDGSVDIFIVKTDADGNEIWHETFGGSGNDFGEDILALPTGGCVIAGNTNSFGEGGSDVILIRLTPDGNIDAFHGTPNHQQEKLLFYPNPMTSSAFFVIPGNLQTSYIIQLFDSSGHLISEYETSKNRFKLQRGNLSAGIYYYKFITKAGQSVDFSGKIVIK